jgi:hypothetical protein
VISLPAHDLDPDHDLPGAAALAEKIMSKIRIMSRNY